MMLLDRPRDEAALRRAVVTSPVTLMTGPRWAGKTTLARWVLRPSPGAYFDLDYPEDWVLLDEPEFMLDDRGETILIDNAQNAPELAPILQAMLNRSSRSGRFVLIGNVSQDLMKPVIAPLADRTSFVELGGLRLSDTGRSRLDDLWMRGGLPEPNIASTDERSGTILDGYIDSLTKRELAGPGGGHPSQVVRRLWKGLAHHHGRGWHAARIAEDIGVPVPTLTSLLDALRNALLVRLIPAWDSATPDGGARSPRMYLRDSGLLHRLLGISTWDDLLRNPVLQTSWEGLVIEQLLAMHQWSSAPYWDGYGDTRIALRVEFQGRTLGMDIGQILDTVELRSARSALEALGLDHLIVVGGSTPRRRLDDRITAVSAVDLLTKPLSLEDFES